MRMRKLILLSLSFAIALAMSVSAQNPQDLPGTPRQPGKPPGDPYFGKKEKKPDNTRSLSGVVEDNQGQSVKGAVVKLKDTKTLEIRSFITLDDGSYRFHGLSTETDYEVKATHEQTASRTRRLSVYDSRREATINLKLEESREKESKSS